MVFNVLDVRAKKDGPFVSNFFNVAHVDIRLLSPAEPFFKEVAYL
jgi:hypothetical protein